MCVYTPSWSTCLLSPPRQIEGALSKFHRVVILKSKIGEESKITELFEFK